MGKKTYLRAKGYSFRIESTGPDTAIMKIIGVNSKGKSVEISVDIHDYDFPIMISQMAKICRRRVQSATDRMKQITNAINE